MTSRRAFVGQVAAGLVVARAVPAAVAQALREVPEVAASGHAPTTPVVSFFLDQPYLDLTGREMPYIPPQGLRSGEPLARLSEEAFRSAHCWV